MQVNIGFDLEKRMHAIDIMRQLENVRYNLYTESRKHARDVDNMEKDNCPEPLNIESLKPFLSDDEGIGKLDDMEEITTTLLFPPKSSAPKISLESLSVRSKVKFRRKKYYHERGYLEWEGDGLLR